MRFIITRYLMTINSFPDQQLTFTLVGCLSCHAAEISIVGLNCNHLAITGRPPLCRDNDLSQHFAIHLVILLENEQSQNCSAK